MLQSDLLKVKVIEQRLIELNTVKNHIIANADPNECSPLEVLQTIVNLESDLEDLRKDTPQIELLMEKSPVL